MPDLPAKITFRPSTLAGPMASKLVETRETPSEYVRRLIAADCGVEPPEMRAGNPDIAAQSAAGVAARNLGRALASLWRDHEVPS